MTQSYNNEARDSLIDEIQRLSDAVGYHFVWCRAYLGSSDIDCDCGMYQIRQAKARLTRERQEEYDLWADALGLP